MLKRDEQGGDVSRIALAAQKKGCEKQLSLTPKRKGEKAKFPTLQTSRRLLIGGMRENVKPFFLFFLIPELFVHDKGVRV